MSYRVKAASLLAFFIFALVIGVGVSAAPARAARLKALIVTGQSNHNWRLSTPILMQILEQTNLFDVDIAIGPAEGDDMKRFGPDFAAYDLVVLNYVGDSWQARTNAAFVEYVRRGGGIVAVHSACNAFPEWKEYNRILGLGGWYGRDERWGPYVRWRGGKIVRDYIPGKGGSHPDKHAFQVIIRDKLHPVTKGLPEKWMHAKEGLNIELRGPAEDLTVLATAYADPAISGGTGEHEPVIFTVGYGAGRVFHTVLGHANNAPVSAMECVGFIVTLQRGAEWAATGEVTQAIPNDFPTATEVRRWRQCKPPQLSGSQRIVSCRSDPGDTARVEFETISSSGVEATSSATIGVVLSKASKKAVTVKYMVTEGTAEESVDYSLASGTLIFEPGVVRRQIGVNIVDDRKHEPAETIVIQLCGPTNALLGAKTQHSYTINDDDDITRSAGTGDGS